jgi:hypothetical protein
MTVPDKGGTMKTHKLPPFFLALPLVATSLACPTRNIDPSDNGGSGGSETQTGGHGGAPQTGAGGAAGLGLGGVSGAPGSGGTGLAGAGGIAGAAGTGGVAGGTGFGGALGTGGAAGVTGAGGVAGVTGTGGSLPTCSPACSSSTQTCVGTSCLLNDGQSCSVASQCVSNNCTPFYVDQDGDGYGTGQATGFCGTTPPVGYSAQTGDCCDTATNIAVAKLIHPGAGYQTTSAGGVCNITWDYDCSGSTDVNPAFGTGQCANGTTYPTCDSVKMPFPSSDCGMTVHDSDCGQYNTSCAVQGGPQVLGCR